MYNDTLTPSVIALGMFDGMHLGHRAVIENAVSIAREKGFQSVAFTFVNHPRSVFAEAPQPLMSAEKKRDIMKAMGIDAVDMVVFDREMAALTPSEFIRMLLRRYDIRVLVAGSDYTFGRGGLGTIDTLRELAGEFGFEVREVPFVMLGGEKISSTRIREALKVGDDETAKLMMGCECRVP